MWLRARTGAGAQRWMVAPAGEHGGGDCSGREEEKFLFLKKNRFRSSDIIKGPDWDDTRKLGYPIPMYI